MSVPVVATNIRGCRQVVEHGRTGLLVEPKNASSLARAVARLVDDPVSRQLMGRNGRAKALDDFDQRSVIELTLDVYRSLLEERGMSVPDQPWRVESPWYADSIDLVARTASKRSAATSEAVVPSRVRSSGSDAISP